MRFLWYNKNMRIQKLTKSYIKDISSICTNAFLDGEYSFYLQKGNLSGLDKFLDFCSVKNLSQKMLDNKYMFFGALEENTLVGTACINSKNGNILLLFVDIDYQKQGVGKMLVAFLVGLAKELGLKKLTVDATHFGVRFYEKMGFEKLSEEQILEGGLIFTPMRKKIQIKK